MLFVEARLAARMSATLPLERTDDGGPPLPDTPIAGRPAARCAEATIRHRSAWSTARSLATPQVPRVQPVGNLAYEPRGTFGTSKLEFWMMLPAAPICNARRQNQCRDLFRTG
jgi:hypothetical protein